MLPPGLHQPLPERINLISPQIPLRIPPKHPQNLIPLIKKLPLPQNILSLPHQLPILILSHSYLTILYLLLSRMHMIIPITNRLIYIHMLIIPLHTCRYRSPLLAVHVHQPLLVLLLIGLSQ